MPDSPDQHNELDRWIESATEDLTRGAAARLAEEFRDHYAEAYDAAIAEGRSEDEAHTAAMRHLGDPNSTHRAAIPVHGDPHRLKVKGALVAIGLLLVSVALTFQLNVNQESALALKDEYSLLEFIEEGDVKQIRRELERGATPPEPSLTILFGTQLEKDVIVELTRLLLEHGADPNYVDPAGSPVVFSLVKRRDSSDESLTYRNKHRGELLKLLIKHGADPGWKRNDAALSLLEYASQQNDDIIMSILLNNGYKDSVISILLRRDFNSFQQMVVEDPGMLNRPIQGRFGATPMHLVASLGKLPILKRAVALGGSLDVKPNKITLLHCAYMEFWEGWTPPSIEITKYLLESGCDPNESTNLGSCLHFAVFRGPEHTKLLLDAGADPNIPNSFNEIPLHSILLPRVHFYEYIGDHEVEQVTASLIEAGSNVNTVNNIGHTPLHYAALGNRTKVIDALINSGADIELSIDERSKGPFLYDNSLPPGHRPLHVTAADSFRKQTSRDSNDSIDVFLDLGASINAKGHNGQTPLLAACEAGYLDNVRTLLERGADPRHSRRRGQNGAAHRGSPIARTLRGVRP